MTQKTKGNIADNGTIEIKSSSTYENNLPRNLVDFDKSNFFQSLNDKTIVCFDLKDKLFQLTDYSIKSHNRGSYSRYHLKDWAVEVSLDGETWEVVDDHKNDSSLNGPNISASFSTKKTNSFYRYVRIRQTGPPWNKSNMLYLTTSRLAISNLEILGKLKMQTKYK